MYQKILKRVLDILLSVIALLLLTLPMAIVALAIKMEDPGPALFKQKRVGKGKKLFWLYKFRSMKVSTPDVPTHLLKDPEQYITKLGRYVSSSAQIMPGCIIEPMAVIQSMSIISRGCIVSAGAVVNHASMCCDGVHVDCNATVAGATLVPAGTKIKSGEVYDRKAIDVNDFFYDSEAWAKKLNEIKQPHTPTPINGKTYNFDDVM